MMTPEKWSKMTVEQKFEHITAEATALKERQDALNVRFIAISRAERGPLNAAEAAELCAIVTEQAEIDGVVHTLKVARETLGGLPKPGPLGWIGRMIGRGYTPLRNSP